MTTSWIEKNLMGLGHRHLDIGCGDGRLVNDMSQKFDEVSFAGVDFDIAACGSHSAPASRSQPSWRLRKATERAAVALTVATGLETTQIIRSQPHLWSTGNPACKTCFQIR